jgi:homopolymeric O-antigen transport system permease protein
VIESTVTSQPLTSESPELPEQGPASVPEQPLVTIEPTRAWTAPNLRNLWTYHELLLFLIWRDLKVRYKQTALGVAWVIMQPLLLTLIFTVFLGILVRVPSDGAPYPLFVYLGLLPWTFFSSSVTSGAASLIANAHLITKVYFPRMLIPMGSLGARLVDFAISFVILAGMLIYYRIPLTLNLVWLPLLILLVALLALSCSMLTAALNVKYRDVGFILPVIVQAWMFVSPVLYPLGLIPAKWRKVYSLNPLVGIIDGFRAACLGSRFNWTALVIAFAVAVLLFVWSVYLFRRVEKSFADFV